MLEIGLSKLLGQIGGPPAARVDSVDLSKKRLAKQHAEQENSAASPFSNSTLQGQLQPTSASAAANSSCPSGLPLQATASDACSPHPPADSCSSRPFQAQSAPATLPTNGAAHTPLPSHPTSQASATAAATAVAQAAAAVAASAVDDGGSEASSVPLNPALSERADSLTLARARGVAEHPRAVQRRLATSPPPSAGRKSSGSASEVAVSPLHGGSSRNLRKGKKAASCDASQLSSSARRASESEGYLRRRRGSEGGWQGGQGLITLLKRGFQTFASELQHIGSLHHTGSASGDEREHTSGTLSRGASYKNRSTSASASQRTTRSSNPLSSGHSLKSARKSWNGDVRERAHSAGAAVKREPSGGATAAAAGGGAGGAADGYLHTPRWFSRLSVGKSRRGSADSTRHSSFSHRGCGGDLMGSDVESSAPAAAAAATPAAGAAPAGAVAEAQSSGHSSASSASATATAAAFMAALHSRAGSSHGRNSDCGQCTPPQLPSISSSQPLLMAL